MNTLRYLFFLLLLAPLTGRAISVAEGPDFPNNASGTAYVLESGANVFSGTITTPNDIQDRFKVTVPAGMVINSITRNFSDIPINPSYSSYRMQNAFITFNLVDSIGVGSASMAAGQGPGTYECLVNANFAVGNAWTITFNVGPTPPVINSVTPPSDGAYLTAAP